MSKHRRLSRRKCLHHNHRTGQTWIHQFMINVGMNKKLWCERCGKVWII